MIGHVKLNARAEVVEEKAHFGNGTRSEQAPS
jgi:hypothetical protein